jgi:hypothetical protein
LSSSSDAGVWRLGPPLADYLNARRPSNNRIGVAGPETAEIARRSIKTRGISEFKGTI